MIFLELYGPILRSSCLPPPTYSGRRKLSERGVYAPPLVARLIVYNSCKLRSVVYRKFVIFENHTLKALNIPFKKVVLPGRVKGGGTEEDKVVAHGCRKRKKLICGPEEEIVLAHGRLPSPTRERERERFELSVQ